MITDHMHFKEIIIHTIKIIKDIKTKEHSNKWIIIKMDTMNHPKGKLNFYFI